MLIKRLLPCHNLALRSTLQGSRLSSHSYSKSTAQKPRSGHAEWYSDIAPAMIPIFLLGSATYLGLQLAQQKLSHAKFMEEALVRVRDVEAEVDALQEKRARLTQDTTLPPSVNQTKKTGWW